MEQLEPSTGTRGGRHAGDLPSSPETTLGALLGTCEQDVPVALDRLVREATGVRPEPSRAVVETVPHALGSPATAGVHRIHGTGTDGTRWSLFCKGLHHLRHWPGLSQIPEPIATHFADTFPWRSELELWDPRVQESLPPGLRSPRLARIVELGDDRIAVWQEDIAIAPCDWTDQDFAHAAYLLGRWNARSTTAEVLAVTDLPSGYALRMYAENAVLGRGLPALADERLWSHPWLHEHQDLARDLLAHGDRIPALLDRLDTFPPALPHGDASPQNLLVPADENGLQDGLVVIDLSFRSPHALGFDLGQLLVGLIHADVLPASRLPGIAAAIVPAYLDGLAAEGVAGDTVPEAFAISVLLRSGFDGFLYDELGRVGPDQPPTAAFAQRIALARFLVQHFDDTVGR